MDLVNQIIDQVPTSTYPFIEFRKLLLQIDRESSRKKSIRGLHRIYETCGTEIKPYVLCGLGMAYYLDRDFTHALSYLKDVVIKYPLSPVAIYASTMVVLIYQTLGMKRERFEAEGSRLLLMKKIAMQSNDPNHRVLALSELKTELEARELHEEAQKCDLELHYWNSFIKKNKPRTTISKTYSNIRN